MGCRCKERRKDLNHIRNLAIRFSKMNEEDIQIYSYIENDETYYNFEPINNERENIIEYYEWTKNKRY